MEPTPARTAAQRSRLRDLGLNLALAASTVVLVVGGAELVCRFSEPPAAPRPAEYITDWQAWDGDFYTVKSTAVGWPPWEDYNTEGLRDREHPLAKRPGSYRVACLGDSVTLGWGIQPQQAWPQVLEDLAAASGRDLDVMNVALGGWATRQELIAYRRIARRYHPDQVLLGICLNDVAEMQNNLSRPSKLLSLLHRRSALVRRVVAARDREIRDVQELFTSPQATRVREGYERMFADLRKLRDEVRADGGRFAVVVFPFRFQVVPGAPPALAQRAIGEFCRQEAIPFLDALPGVADLGDAAFHDYDHFSPAGARRVAEQILDAHLLPEQPGTATPAGPAAAPAGIGHDPRPLVQALLDPSEARRVAAARALATLAEAGAVAAPALVRALDDPSHAVRVAAAWALGDIGTGGTSAVPRLRALLEDPDPLLRAGAAHALGEIGDAAKPAVRQLIARFADGDEHVRWSAADAVGKLKPGTGDLPPLLRLLTDAPGPGRGLAAEALGRIGPEARAAVPELIETAFDTRADVRWRAVWALGRMGPAAAAAVPLLRRTLQDPDLRWRAAEALGGIGPGAVDSLPDLVALLRDPSSSVRWRAASALGAIGSRQAAPGLAGVVQDSAENVRLAAVTSLLQVNADGPRVERAFLEASHDPDSRVRARAVRGVRRLGLASDEARAAIALATRDPDEGVRAEATRALPDKRH